MSKPNPIKPVGGPKADLRRVYLSNLSDCMWEYVETSPNIAVGDLEFSARQGDRPPVFGPDALANNLLYPSSAGEAVKQAIREAIPTSERHRYFGSMRSSQALAQSVFGGLIAVGKIGALQGLSCDNGHPAFPGNFDTDRVRLEHSVDWLGEPRATSIDVWFDGELRIAVECKLTEADFGTCSRPRLRQGRDANFERDHCDGSYSRQRGRAARCSLTEIGVRYWEYIPSLFNWDRSNDLALCPLSDTYQLVRNVLAACVRSDGAVMPEDCHVLVIYDARNPSFQLGGIADTQWHSAKSSLKYHDCLRRITWQSLAAHLASDPDLKWLVSGLARKYGIAPSPH